MRRSASCSFGLVEPIDQALGHAHLGKIEDGITATAPIASRYPDFAALLTAGEEDEMLLRLRGPKALADRSAIPLFSTGWRSKAGARSSPLGVGQGQVKCTGLHPLSGTR